RKPASEIIASSKNRASVEAARKPDSSSVPGPQTPAATASQAGDQPPSGRPETPVASAEPSADLIPPPESPASAARPSAPEVRPGILEPVPARRKASQCLAESRQQQKEGLLLTARALHDQATTSHLGRGVEDDVSDEQL